MKRHRRLTDRALRALGDVLDRCAAWVRARVEQRVAVGESVGPPERDDRDGSPPTTMRGVPADWESRLDAGPPAHWLERVRRGAPQLLESEVPRDLDTRGRAGRVVATPNPPVDSSEAQQPERDPALRGRMSDANGGESGQERIHPVDRARGAAAELPKGREESSHAAQDSPLTPLTSRSSGSPDPAGSPRTRPHQRAGRASADEREVGSRTSSSTGGTGLGLTGVGGDFDGRDVQRRDLRRPNGPVGAAEPRGATDRIADARSNDVTTHVSSERRVRPSDPHEVRGDSSIARPPGAVGGGSNSPLVEPVLEEPRERGDPQLSRDPVRRARSLGVPVERKIEVPPEVEPSPDRGGAASRRAATLDSRQRSGRQSVSPAVERHLARRAQTHGVGAGRREASAPIESPVPGEGRPERTAWQRDPQRAEADPNRTNTNQWPVSFAHVDLDTTPDDADPWPALPSVNDPLESLTEASPMDWFASVDRLRREQEGVRWNG